MESFTGRVTKDGKTIADDVHGSIFHAHDDTPGWHGTLDTGDPQTAHDLLLMDGFEIELGDGRQGHALGSGHTPGTSVIDFTGSGPLE
jgi:hypothetical protein